MTYRLNPYLSFVSSTREAMTFYQSVLGGELDVMTFADMGTEGEHADRVMHARLVTEDDLVLMASDRLPEMGDPVVGDSVMLSMHGDDTERLRGHFAALSEGGEVHTPLAVQMWGDEYGDLTDRFGMRWMFNIAVTEAS